MTATGAPRAIAVIGLGYGDCGKGGVVDFLVRRCQARLVVRFNGGPQAGHNVVTSDGRHHTFSQFGSGSFVPGVRTLLSRFMLIEPYAMFNEAAHLEALGVADAWDRLLIDARCPVITPAHQAANRLRELARGEGAHGTCGMGVGEAAQDLAEHPELVLRAGDLDDPVIVRDRMTAMRGLKLAHLGDAFSTLRTHPQARSSIDALLDPSWIDVGVETCVELAKRVSILDEQSVCKLLRAPGTLVLEGAQGVLLDESFGFHPHTTWSNTTLANSDALLEEAGCDGRCTKLGVLRAYLTRHGAGPLVTEDHSLSAALPEPHNGDDDWPGKFRVGVFDAVAARYALAVAGPIDALAITHLDRLPRLPRCVCNAYRPAAEDVAWASSPYFRFESHCITDILPRRPADLAHQQRLTRMLSRCRPIYKDLPARSADSFLEVIQEELRAPVGLTSFGPTADDKRLEPRCLD